MELEERPFRVIDVIYLRNMVHNVKVQKAMKKNWIRDKERLFPLPQCYWKQHDKCTRHLL